MTDKNTVKQLPKLRVLVVLPLYGGSLPVGRYAASGLAELGHSVEVFEAPEFHTAFSAFRKLKIGTDRLQDLENHYLHLLGQAVVAKSQAFEPDIVLAMAQAPLDRQSLKRLRSDGVVTAMWFVEDYRLFTYWRAFAPWYDIFAVIQKEPFVSELKNIGVDGHLYLPLAAHPEFHRPLSLSSVERKMYGSDISFLGAGYPNRRNAFKKLTNYDFKIWGSEWDHDELLAPFVQRKGARIEPIEAVKIFNATKVNLNLHSSVNPRATVVPGDFVNPRVFEIAACGAFQIVDQRALMPELYSEDEMALFSSMEGLKDRIDFFLGRPEERQAITERSRSRTLKDHTYAQRMEKLLSFVREKKLDFPTRRHKEAPLQGLPPELAQEVSALIERLKLPQDVGFDDLIWALRNEKGELTSLETSLLFLDEFQKQYKKKIG